MTVKKVKAFLYTRISSLQQQQGFGIQRQINNVMDFLTEAKLPHGLGYELDPENYELLASDLGKSAYKGHNFSKGELGRFMERVINGEITEGVLLIENADRFSRLPDYEAIEQFNALIKRGIDVIEVESGQVFSTKLDGTLSKLAVSIERSHQESKRKARLTTKNWEKMRKTALENGKALNNNCPMWLSVVDEQYVIDQQMVDVIRQGFERFAEGYNGASVVRYLNESGLKINNRNWSAINLYHALRNKRLIGYIRDIKYYPAVIDLELFNRVQLLLDKGNNKKSLGTKELFLTE
jgi:DNA invertase Pin-like site-specific DNA recombinase